jgi:hypothetical protein
VTCSSWMTMEAHGPQRLERRSILQNDASLSYLLQTMVNVYSLLQAYCRFFTCSFLFVDAKAQ